MSEDPKTPENLHLELKHLEVMVGDQITWLKGAVRRMRTRLSMALISQFYAAQSCCHSTRAASR